MRDRLDLCRRVVRCVQQNVQPIGNDGLAIVGQCDRDELTGLELGSKSGLGNSNISVWLRGRSTPSMPSLRAIENFLVKEGALNLIISR